MPFFIKKRLCLHNIFFSLKDVIIIMPESTKTYVSELIDKIGYINGIYIPWFHAKWFGRDIGPNFTVNYPECYFNEDYVRKVLYNCKAIGFDMAKIWLNESHEGMGFDSKGTVTGVEPLFLKNFERMLQKAKEAELKMAICLVAHSESDFAGEKFLYDKYNRYIQVEAETEKYIQNYLYSVLNIAKKYGVTLVDIYAEPEADGDIWNVTRGISWEAMTRFINRIHKAVKDFDPRMATTVSSGCACNTILEGRYSNITVDYYGADIYSDEGDFPSTCDMLLEKPFMLGEYGLSNYAGATDDIQIETIKKFYNNCMKYGVAGGFYWCYGWDGEGGEMHIVDKEGNLRKTAAYLHFLNIDRENKRKAISKKDVPCLIITDSTDDIQLFGSRGAKEYLLETQNGGKWHEAARIPAENYEEYPDIIHVSYPDAPDKALYRVTAFFADGSNTVSPALMLKKKVTY